MQINTRQVTPATIEEVEKSQAVRLLDVAVFGPLMVMSAMNKEPPKWMRLVMLGIGIGTIVYNAQNYMSNLPRNNLAGLCNCKQNGNCQCVGRNCPCKTK